MSTHSPSTIPDAIGIIAGKGAYPRLLAESARAQGVKRITALAFKGETDKRLEPLVDAIDWINVGQLQKMLDLMSKQDIQHAVMAGQITPTNLFRVRMDSRLLTLLKSLDQKNAHTIFGAIGNELASVGIELLPANQFMEQSMAEEGILTNTPLSETARTDIELGFEVARVTSGLDIGQTVVIKEGTILAIEAFEGTDTTIKRAGKLAGPGASIIKVAKPGHDMRFDIPVIGLNTLRGLKKIQAQALAVEAGRCILLEKEKIIKQADQQGLCIAVYPPVDRENNS